MHSTCSPSHLALSDIENLLTSVHGEQYKSRISNIHNLPPSLCRFHPLRPTYSLKQCPLRLFLVLYLTTLFAAKIKFTLEQDMKA
jgi:hypothetical protein